MVRNVQIAAVEELAKAVGHLLGDADEHLLEVGVGQGGMVGDRLERPVETDDRRAIDLEVNVRGAGIDGALEDGVEIHGFGTTPIGRGCRVL